MHHIIANQYPEIFRLLSVVIAKLMKEWFNISMLLLNFFSFILTPLIPFS